MKKWIDKKSLCRSILSLVVLGIFLVLAAGSFDMLMVDMLGFSSGHSYNSETKEETIYYWIGADKSQEAPIYITGKLDSYGMLHGPVNIALRDESGEVVLAILIDFNHGYINGDYRVIYPGGTAGRKRNFFMDLLVEDKEPGQKKSLAENSGFDRLNMRYVWLLDYLYGFGYSEDYVEHYMDTMEIMLSEYTFESYEFDDYYDEVVDRLAETPHDSIIELNSALSGIRGLDLIKRFELRLAVIDHCRSQGISTYDIVSATYPGLLALLDDTEVSHADFEVFCDDLDDSLAVYGPLDTEDPFFIDSVDAYMYRAIMSIYASGEDTLKKSSSINPGTWKGDYRTLRKICKDAFRPEERNSEATTSPEIAEMVLYTILMEFMEGDMIKRSVREAYLKRSGIIAPPVVATQFVENLTESSTRIEGYVLENGGAEVIARGIAWAGFHNPTVEDNVEMSGHGTGEFTADLCGLSEGGTYYARAFATNSTGTVYGNCVSFVASSTTGIGEKLPAGEGLELYPNPASSHTTCHFRLAVPADVNISVRDLSGRTVFRDAHGILPPGDQRIKLDLTGLPGGTYYCVLTGDGNMVSVQKLVVVH